MKQYPILLQVFWTDTQFHETIPNFAASFLNWYPVSWNHTQFCCKFSELIPNFMKQYAISLQIFQTDTQFHENNTQSHCKSSELIPSFMKQYPILFTFKEHSKLEMKRGLEPQTRAERYGVVTFHITFIMPCCFKNNNNKKKLTYLWKHYWNQLWTFWDLRKINKEYLSNFENIMELWIWENFNLGTNLKAFDQ
jgi:hypothetical protein